MTHECVKEEAWGEQKQINKSFFDHISDGRGWRISLIGIVFALVMQVVTFAVLWGQMTTKLSYQEKLTDKQDARIERMSVMIEKYLIGQIAEAKEK